MSIKSPHYPSDPSVKWKEEGGLFILKPRGLSITWGNENRYWHLPEPNEDGPAKLLNVCLLEVEAAREIDPKKSYQIGFRVSLMRRWAHDCPIFIMAKRGERGNYISRRVILEGRPLHEEFDIPENFVVKFLPGDSSEPKLHICLFDHWTSNWKGGLLIHHAFVREVNDGKGK
ncbi:hypothetical protein LguiA_011070 [Lonicera macranthoides]